MLSLRKGVERVEWETVFHQRINELWERAKDTDYKLTQPAYAKRLGVSRNSFVGWLRGSGQPNSEGFVRIAVAENVSLEWLLGDPRAEFTFQDEESHKFIQKFRYLTSAHKKDLFVMLENFYEQDKPHVKKKEIS